MAPLIFSGHEVDFSSDEIIVSKTNLKGNITYVNQTFCKISGYKEIDMLGKPHSIIRHANMPRCIFKLIWDKIQTGQEIFGYVVNRTIDENYYWVLAHITPSFDDQGQIIGFHSNRRSPDKRIISSIISPLYADLLQIEETAPNRKDGMMSAYNKLTEMISSKGVSYDEFILTL